MKLARSGQRQQAEHELNHPVSAQGKNGAHYNIEGNGEGKNGDVEKHMADGGECNDFETGCQAHITLAKCGRIW